MNILIGAIITISGFLVYNKAIRCTSYLYKDGEKTEYIAQVE